MSTAQNNDVPRLMEVPESFVTQPGSSDPYADIVRLFDEFRDALFRYLRWLGCTPDEADDTIQETFLRLQKHLLANGSQDNLRAWLFRVAGNLVYDDRKSGRRRLNRALEDHAWQDPAVNPEQLALQRESTARLGTLIRGLPSDQQRCLALRSEGFRYREIAEILGVSISTVADLLRRAIAALARELA